MIDDLKVIQERQRLNRLKSKFECLTCEVVVPKGLEEHPMSILQGNCDEIEVGIMILNLEEIVECLKKNFPEVKQILPELRRHGRLKESYKYVKEERFSRGERYE